MILNKIFFFEKKAIKKTVLKPTQVIYFMFEKIILKELGKLILYVSYKECLNNINLDNITKKQRLVTKTTKLC